MKEVKPQKAWFARQYELFHEAIHTGAPLPVELADARAALELITACYHSNDTGQAVQLPIGPDHPKYRGWVPTAPTNKAMAARRASAVANQRR